MVSNANYEAQQSDLLKTQAPQFTFDQVKEIVRDLFGLSGEISSLESERDQNFHLVTSDGDHYVVRIANSAEDQSVVDMQTKALEHIARVDPELPVPIVLHSLQGNAFEVIRAENGAAHVVHLITYLHGKQPSEKPIDPGLLRPIGACLARLSRALRGFFHPAADYEILWDLKHAAKIKHYLPYLTDPTQHQVAAHFLDRFSSQVLPQLPKLRAQIIHNDFTPDNMLVAEDDPRRVVGILDFGDMVHSLLVSDLAITIASTLRSQTDPVEAAVEIVAAYHEIIPLEPDEINLIFDLVAARLTSLVVIAAWRTVLHPENEAYITGGAKYDWETLKQWYTRDPEEVTKLFFRACGIWEQEQEVEEPSQSGGDSYQARLARRTRLLGPCYYLFYQRPLTIVRGQGVWLYDEEGRRYLDVYNNVPHVGHCHPHVLHAINEQGRRLNTSSRYIHGYILDLAEEITARMPESLSVCMFVCTGTEANELAWRMAKLVSGNRGALITHHSYHGNSDAIINFSPESMPAEKLPAHVQMLDAPTSNSTFLQPDSGIGASIQDLAARGYSPAMLILDSGFTSDGIYTAPQGYLSMLYDKARAAGALCVADEVQAGFGRLGGNFWGFEYGAVEPDIVTMGKSMGNGHPIAAVVTRPEIAEALAKDTGYFNTYGGNPVSCAAALAVLHVIEKEDLQSNARQVGGYLTGRLQELRQEFPVLGAPHGAGLLQGVDISRADGSPDAALAARIMNHMREYGVLIGTTGKHSNTLKIRPPLVFQKEHAEIFLTALKNALEALH